MSFDLFYMLAVNLTQALQSNYLSDGIILSCLVTDDEHTNIRRRGALEMGVKRSRSHNTVSKLERNDIKIMLKIISRNVQTCSANSRCCDVE